VMPTMIANRTTTPAPIAIFFQGFMVSVAYPGPYSDGHNYSYDLAGKKVP
jgi:hypothetical protein